MSASWYWTPPSPKPYILTFPTGALEQSLRAVWDAARAAVLILAQIKLTSQLSSCASVFSWQLWRPMKQPRVDFLPATGLHEEPEPLLYQQRPLAPIRFLGECRRIWVSLSWFLNLLYWLRVWVLFGGGGGYLPPPTRKDTGVGGPGETSGAYCVGLSWKIPRNSHPVKRCWVGGWLKHARRIAHPLERYWVGGLDWEKNQGIPRAQLKDAEVVPL